MDFWKVISENVEKKNIHFITNISIYTVTDILKFYEVLFCTYCKGLFCLVFLFMNKTLPTLGNEKEQQQIKFYEKF